MNSGRHGREQHVRRRPDVDVAFAVLLGESDSGQSVRRELELGDVKTPADAVWGENVK